MKQLKAPSLLANMITVYLEGLWDDPEESQEVVTVMKSLSTLENGGWSEQAVKNFQNAISGLDGLKPQTKIDFIELLIKNYKK